jgi:hypothetical protein
VFVNFRIRRLVSWAERSQTPVKPSSVGHTLCIVTTLATALAVTYLQLLTGMHAATEWLVR